MRRLAFLLVLGGCGAGQARPHAQSDRAFDACYDSVRAHSCAQLTAAEQGPCMDRLGLQYEGLRSRSERRALLVREGCPEELVGKILGR